MNAENASYASLLLPERARLLHIGLPKTGTTALQRAASAKREQLLDAGVRYPGDRVNHMLAVSGLMGRRWGWPGPGHHNPPQKHWTALMKEVEADAQRRIWISHEFASESDDAMAARFAAELGERLHVVLTLRSFGAMLPSSWQQYLKSGATTTFEVWLGRVLRDPPDLRTTPSFHRRNDQGGVVERWARVVGRENMTVLVLDRSRPEVLLRAFNGLLGLPDGLLAPSERGDQMNRSMSATEAELVRQVNVRLDKSGVEWPIYERVLRNGAVARMLAERLPGSQEDPLTLPSWAADRAEQLGRQYADQIAASGVRVVGDLDLLRARPSSRTVSLPEVTQVPLEVAADSLTGAVLGAAGLHGLSDGDGKDGRNQAARPDPLRLAEQATSAVSARDLVQVLRRRVTRRLRSVARERARR